MIGAIHFLNVTNILRCTFFFHVLKFAYSIV